MGGTRLVEVTPESWPTEEEEANEEMVNIELRKTSNRSKEKVPLEIITKEVTMINSTEEKQDIPWYLQILSIY